MNPIVLGPAWQLRPVARFNQGLYPLDDEDWLEQELPAHWQEHPRLENHSGNVVYRLRFAHPSTLEGGRRARRWALRADGIFYWSQFYLNGRALEQHEGYFAAQEHDVSAMLERLNTLVLEVACPEEHDKRGKRMITGVFSHWDCIDPETNPGGVWLPVTLEQSGPVRLRQVALRTTSLTSERAVLEWSAEVDSLAALAIELRWSLVPATFVGEPVEVRETRIVRGGLTGLSGSFTVEGPRLWRCHDLGRPDLYHATLEVRALDEVSDRRSFRFGVRTFELRRFVPHLNGERLLVKGNNYAPGDTRIARMTPERARADIDLARRCHMNLLRVHAHVDHPALYDAADELGVLLWQDFPMQWLYRRSVLPQARAQARRMVELLGNHPSVVVWCMHNEPVYLTDTSDLSLLTALQTYASVFVWSWNRDVMDRRLQRDVRRVDATRPAISNSGEYAVPGWHRGNDTHFYFGWYPTHGPLRRFDWLRRQFPRNLRFVTEFGAQSFPNRESCEKFMAGEIEKIDWTLLARRHSFQPEIMARWYDWRSCRSLDELIEQSQRYQIDVNRFYIDRLRMSKYRPTGGIVPFMFADSHPAVQWSILDYWRVPKASYRAMRDAFRPHYAWTLLDADEYPVGQVLELPIYVVNDARVAVDFAVEAMVVSTGGSVVAHVKAAGELEADCLPLVATRLSFVPAAPDDYRLRITLRTEDEPFHNEYTIRVSAGSAP
ncbi:MAG: GH2 [uncultured Chloroflexia bacterium]|uniref:beta-mannosidase n=1 Tax=uncultured Chloroflexia bacterium TaxID=1672391 RepID=A0A6J4HZM3_9CHLR|nr:MAG: GH2 [uncultured Chloroflexia bacterium]